MVTIKKISKTQLPQLVLISYLGDDELLNKFHVEPNMSFKMAVGSTLQMIYDLSSEKRLNYYKVIYNKMPIGYFVTFDNCLYSFGINIDFRVKNILISWWQQIKKALGKEFYAKLYEQNTRAISFLEKCGMEIYHRDEINKVVTLLTN